MTGHSPRLRATADLDPISPSPVHPPSPITVPALQDQADMYSDMSLAGANPIALAAASCIGALKVNGEQNHVPTPAPIVATDTSVATVTIPNDAPNGLPDAKLGHVGSTDLKERATNGEDRRAELASAGMSAENTQELETSQSDTTKAEQHVPELNEQTYNPDTSTLTSCPAQLATSTHENNHPISQISADLSSHHIPQPTHKLPDSNDVISNSIMSTIDSARFFQPSSEQPLANSSHYSHTTNHLSNQVTNLQATLDFTTAYAGNTDVVHIPMSKDVAKLNGLPQNIILPPKPPNPEILPTYQSLSAIPAVPQSSVVPLPPSNGVAPKTTPVLDYAISKVGCDIKHESLPADHSLLIDRQKQQYDIFIQEERKYVSEAKWDRFPDGSRIFIGNLPSDRVSKREVFDIFSKFGRLAQISLKQVYGFVQYHTHAEGQAAMRNLQGMEIWGKKINLELSRAQKKDGEGSRGNRGRRNGDRQDGNKGRRDDYRPGRQHSPRRSNQRQLPLYDDRHRGRGYQESGYPSERRRSQSPDYNRQNSYRRRSLSPPRRYTTDAVLDIPPRDEPGIPDVQFLILEGIRPEFVSWVQGAFIHEGLTVNTMSLHPRFPRDVVIQRQALDGVHAVVELDNSAESHARVPLLLFKRSSGHNEVQYDKYLDLEPHIAAQFVTGVKSRSLVTSAPYPNGYYPPTQHYPPPAQGYYMPPTYPSQHYPPPMTPSARGTALDPDTIHRILGSLNGQQVIPPVDMNSMLATAPRQLAGPPIQNGMNYGHPPPHMPQGVPYGSNPARHVENIMTQFPRHRQ